MAALAWADPAQGIYWLIGGVFATNLIAATHDISTDGFAVDLLSSKERGWGNGVQVAGYRLGMIFGGSALLVAFEHWGWSATFELAAGTLLLASVAIAFPSRGPCPTARGRRGAAGTGRARLLSPRPRAPTLAVDLGPLQVG